MTAQQYIHSGNLEAWCLGTLGPADEAEFWYMDRQFPEVRLARQQLELEMEQLALQLAVPPRQSLKMKTLLRLNSLPVIDEGTALEDWVDLVSGMIGATPEEPLVFKPLTQRAELSQTLVYSRMDIPNETHDDLHESFFILEGSCQCKVGGAEFVLNAGDFLAIPLHTPHDITLLTTHVLAILQQQVI